MLEPDCTMIVRGDEEAWAPIAEAIAAAVLGTGLGSALDPDDPTTWPADLRRLVEQERDAQLADLRETPGVIEAEPDPDDPRCILAKIDAPVSYFVVRLQPSPGMTIGETLI